MRKDHWGALMASQIITPENLKQTIDAFVKKEGTKAFILSTEKHGDALAPSKKLNLFRIPVAVHGDFLKIPNMGLIKMMHGLYLIPVKDIEDLSDIAREAYEQNTLKDPIPATQEIPDINLLLHVRVMMGDMITIRKDGTVLHNDKVQTEKQMELM